MTSTFKGLTPNMMVTNVNDTVDYYVKFLGFQKMMTMPEEGVLDWAMLVRDSVTIMLQSQKSIAEEYPELKETAIGATLTFYFDIENLEELFEELKNKVTVHKELHDMFYGRKEFVIEDCNGYFLVFSEGKD